MFPRYDFQLVAGIFSWLADCANNEILKRLARKATTWNPTIARNGISPITKTYVESNLPKNYQFLSVLSFWPFRSPETFFYARVLIAGSNAFRFLSLYSLLFVCDFTTRFSIMTSRQTVSTRCIIRMAERNQLSMMSSFWRVIWKRWYFDDSKSPIVSFVSMEGQRRSFVRRMLRLRCNEWKKDGTGIAVVRMLVRNVIKWEVNIGNSDRA